MVAAAGFGRAGCDTVLKCFPATTPTLEKSVNAAVALNVLVSLPLTLFPAVQMMQRRVPDIVKPTVFPAAMISVVAIGVNVQSLARFTSFVGGTVMAILGVVVPVRIFAANAAIPALHGARVPPLVFSGVSLASEAVFVVNVFVVTVAAILVVIEGAANLQITAAKIEDVITSEGGMHSFNESYDIYK